jgi:tetratricopeptide (TPR) repeat protein
MATALRNDRMTPADELRQLLSRSEDRLINLSDSASVAELYTWLDQVASLMPVLRAAGGDVRSEEARWQSLQERVQNRATRVMRAWRSSAVLAAARQAAAPPEANWWWWIDQMIARQRQRRLRRGAGIVLAVLAALAAASFVFQRLFPVDPVQRAAYRLQLQAETELNFGNTVAAYETLSRVLEIDATNFRMWILHGAVADLLGDSMTADHSWQQARSLLADAELPFLIERGMSFVRTQQPDRAITDLEAAIAIDPGSAQAHLVLGSALEAVGRLRDGLAAYERAADLAEAANNPELVVLARVQAANLIPRLQAESAPSSQP